MFVAQRRMAGAAFVAALCLITPTAEAASLSVAPMEGKFGAGWCTVRLTKILSEHFKVVQWEGSARPQVNSFDRLLAYLDAGTQAELVVTGAVTRKRLVLEVYDLKSRRLLGMRRIRTRQRCKPSSRGKKRMYSWISALIAKRPAAQASAVATIPPPEAKPAVTSSVTVHAKPPPQSAPPPSVIVEDPGSKSSAAADSSTTAASQISSPGPSRQPSDMPLCEVGAEVAWARRGLSHGGAVITQLNDHSIGGMPVASLYGRVRLFDALPIKVLRPLAFKFRYARALWVSSSPINATSQEYATSMNELTLAAEYGVRLPISHPVLVSPSVGFHQLQVAVAARGPNEVADVDYQSVRLAIAGASPIFGPVSARAEFAYLRVLEGGAIFAVPYFQRGSANGFELALGARYRLVDFMQVRADARYLTYALDLNPEQTAERFATSASDSVLSLGVGVAAAF